MSGKLDNFFEELADSLSWKENIHELVFGFLEITIRSLGVYFLILWSTVNIVLKKSFSFFTNHSKHPKRHHRFLSKKPSMSQPVILVKKTDIMNPKNPNCSISNMSLLAEEIIDILIAESVLPVINDQTALLISPWDRLAKDLTIENTQTLKFGEVAQVLLREQQFLTKCKRH